MSSTFKFAYRQQNSLWRLWRKVILIASCSMQTRYSSVICVFFHWYAFSELIWRRKGISAGETGLRDHWLQLLSVLMGAVFISIARSLLYWCVEDCISLCYRTELTLCMRLQPYTSRPRTQSAQAKTWPHHTEAKRVPLYVIRIVYAKGEQCLHLKFNIWQI